MLTFDLCTVMLFISDTQTVFITYLLTYFVQHVPEHYFKAELTGTRLTR